MNKVEELLRASKEALLYLELWFGGSNKNTKARQVINSLKAAIKGVEK